MKWFGSESGVRSPAHNGPQQQLRVDLPARLLRWVQDLGRSRQVHVRLKGHDKALGRILAAHGRETHHQSGGKKHAGIRSEVDRKWVGLTFALGIQSIHSASRKVTNWVPVTLRIYGRRNRKSVALHLSLKEIVVCSLVVKVQNLFFRESNRTPAPNNCSTSE